MTIDKFLENFFDDITLQVPKGKKDIIRTHAENTNESLNGFINRAIDEAMQRDKEKHKQNMSI